MDLRGVLWDAPLAGRQEFSPCDYATMCIASFVSDEMLPGYPTEFRLLVWNRERWFQMSNQCRPPPNLGPEAPKGDVSAAQPTCHRRSLGSAADDYFIASSPYISSDETFFVAKDNYIAAATLIYYLFETQLIDLAY